MPGQHATFSPSSLKRLMACPASWKHNKGRANKSSAFASEGTLAHDLAECILTSKELPDTSEFPEMAGYVQDYVNYVRSTQLFNDELWVEKKVRIFRGEVWGTVDAIVLDGDTLNIIDLKYGMGVGVEAINNPQLAAYALGAFNFLEELKGEGFHKTIKTLKMHIFQPRVDNPVKVWEVDDPTAFGAEWHGEIKNTIHECKEDWYFETGSHCQFCPGKVDCPEMAKQTNDAIEKGVEGTADLTVIETADLLKFHDKADAVKQFLKAVEAEILERTMAGEQVRGWKAVQGIGNRTWSIPEEELVKKFKNQKLKQDDYYERKLKSPPQMEKTKKLDKKWIAQFVERPERGIKLVKESDKRPAILTGPVFEDTTKEETDFDLFS